MDINSSSALYQKLKTSVSSLFLEAFKIRESRTSCQLSTDYKSFCLAIKRIYKKQKSAMGSNFESVHLDCEARAVKLAETQVTQDCIALLLVLL